jgi:NAD(P)H dehydrogenase (quinone)
MARERAPNWLIEAYRTMFVSVRAGRFETVATDIPELIGAPQQSYAAFIRTTPPVSNAN